MSLLRKTLPSHVAFLWAGAWIAAVFGIFWLFKVYDWDAGRVRFLVLLAIPPLAYLYRRVGRALPRSPVAERPWAVVAAVAVVIGSVTLAALALDRIAAARSSGGVPSDQGQCISRALDLLLRYRTNPYGRHVMLRPADLNVALRQLEALGCGSGREARRWVRDTWDDRQVPKLSPPYPALPRDGPCARVARLLESMGFVYGPYLLLSHLPFVAAWWEAGILMFYLGLTAAAVIAFVVAARRLTGSAFIALAGAALVVWSPMLRWEVFVQGHSDLVPVTAAVAFWFLNRTGHPTAAALALGVSIGSKTLPGIVFLPLLGRTPHALALACAVAAGGYLPFAIGDVQGVWNNVVYPYLHRSPDSTAIAHYLSPAMRRLLSLAAIAVSAAFAWRWLRSGDLRAELDYLVVAVVAVLATGSVFHNNYLMWLLPVFLIVLLEPFLGRQPEPAPGMPPVES